METRIGIKKEYLTEVAGSLSTLLADEFILYMKTRNAHWNVEGRDFHNMHRFFEYQYETLDEIMDDVAERIRMLGHYAPATFKSLSSLTHLSETSRHSNDSTGFITELLNDHESVIRVLRITINRFANDLHDMGSSDFVTGVMQRHERIAWELRSHV